MHQIFQLQIYTVDCSLLKIFQSAFNLTTTVPKPCWVSRSSMQLFKNKRPLHAECVSLGLKWHLLRWPFLKAAQMTVITHPVSQPLPEEGRQCRHPEMEISLCRDRGHFLARWFSNLDRLKNFPKGIIKLTRSWASALEFHPSWGQGFHRADKCPQVLLG